MKKLLLLFINLLLSINVIFAQVENRSFEFDGETRNYTVFLPQNYQPNMPVVMNLHAWGNSISKWMGYTMMNDIADTAGFIVVYPAGINKVWNWSGLSQDDDVGFISALIDTLDTKYNIDMARIYITGASNGAFMTYRLLGEIGHRFAAAAPVAGALFDLATNWKPSQFIPILIINGTADQAVLYDGANNYHWSVEETINYWIQNNNCSLQADTLLLPDIDITDNCTIEKISWTNCSDNSSIIHYKVIDGAHHWPGGNIEFLSNRDGNLNNDINSSVEMWNFFQNYENPLVNIAWAKSAEVFPEYLGAQGVTLFAKAHITNPENHSISVYALIQGRNSTFKDSVQLFDDGQHGDGNASDNIFGRIKSLTELDEDIFDITLRTTDSDESLSTYFTDIEPFTTAGPVIVDTYNVYKVNDTLIAVDDLVLLNLGEQIGIGPITAELKPVSSCIVGVPNSTSAFGMIEPGETKTGFFTYGVLIGDCGEMIELELEISMGEYVYWKDTLKIEYPLVGLKNKYELPRIFELTQNYPNPFNPSTTLSYSIPTQGQVELKVFDVLGREVTTLIQKEQPQGNYEIEFDASHLTSGIYFYRIQVYSPGRAGEFVNVKKMLLLK